MHHTANPLSFLTLNKKRNETKIDAAPIFCLQYKVDFST